MKYTDWIIPRLTALEDERAALEYIPRQIRVLELKAQGIHSATSDSTPVKGGGNKREEALLANIAERTELENSLKCIRAEVETIDAVLNRLTQEESTVIDRMFVHRQKGNVDRLCHELGYERAQVYRKRNDALLRIARMLLGEVRL